MKKYITRLMAMVLTLATMFTLFAIPASAAVGDTDDKFYTARRYYQAIENGKVVTYSVRTGLMTTHLVTAADRNTFTSDEFLHDKDIAASGYYLITTAGWNKNSPPVYTTNLDKLAQYMPHVTAEIRANLKTLPDGDSNRSYIYAFTDKATALTRTQANDALKAEGRKLTVQTAQCFSLIDTFNEYKNQEIDLLVRGQLISGMAYRPRNYKESDTSAVTFWRDSDASGCASNGKLWVSKSGENDTMVRHLLLGSRTYYYGADTFRNSKLETVVFPADLFSDHYRGYADSTDSMKHFSQMTLRTMAGLFLGKEAIVLGDHAFADNANLKSVIFPTEPARLYFEDGVFSNCPGLTVYAPAGGYIESYCKANGIKFQAIAHGYIEPKVTSTPTIVSLDHIEYKSNTSDDLNVGWYDYHPISDYAPDFTNSFAISKDAHASCALPWTSTFPDLPRLGPPDTAMQDAMVNDLNRYRENRDGQFTLGTPFIGILGLNRTTCWD